MFDFDGVNYNPCLRLDLGLSKLPVHIGSVPFRSVYYGMSEIETLRIRKPMRKVLHLVFLPY